MTPDHSRPLPPPLAAWPHSWRDWVATFGNFDQAVAYATLFWPDFVMYDDGCILLDFDPNSHGSLYSDWKTQTSGDRAAVEAVMNHRHIRDLFANPDLDPSRERLVQLGRLLKQMWECRLQRDFPDRRVVVRFSEEACRELLDYEITLFQQESPAAG